MSTNSRIAVKTEDGYKTIYCHYDGYPEYMYPILKNNYSTEEKALELVSFGDASSISERISPTKDYHSFNYPEDGVCLFYHRDREEPWEFCKQRIYQTKEEIFEIEYYVYIFEDGKWTCYEDGRIIR
jgi:hypothetical protein